MAGKKENPETGKKTVPVFTKEQILSSAKYRSRRDLLCALLKDGETYSAVEIEKMMENFMKGKVN